MAPLSYAKAKDLLTDVEKERLLCVFLTSIDQITKVDGDACATQFGSATGTSFKVMYAGTLRKLRVAGAFLDSSSAAVPTTPTPKKTRKTATDDDEDSPKKKRGRPAKTAAEKFVGKKDTLKRTSTDEEEETLLKTPKTEDDDLFSADPLTF